MLSNRAMDLRRIASRPNVLVILADDMGYSDLACFGSEINTPNLDRLAGDGMRFSQMYNTAKCYPTRASLLTGTYFQQTDREFTSTATAGEVLRPAGYRTLWSGKHHADFNPRTRGFDRFFGMLGGACNFWNPGNAAIPGQPEPARKTHNPWAIDDEHFDAFVPASPDFYTTDVFTDYAINWLGEYKDEEKPFFLYVAYNAPHYPLHAWPADIAKYSGVYDAGYEAIRQARYDRQVAMGLVETDIAPLTEPEWAGQTWDELSAEDKQKEARRMEIYAAMIERLDSNIGRLVEKLRKLGKLDNTLILFLSDNGASPEKPVAKFGDTSGEMGTVNSYESIGKSWATVANTPLRKWKTWSHEGGTCTSMIAHWPAEIKPTADFCRQPCHLIDVMPTVAEIAGACYPYKLNGKLVAPIEGVSLTRAFKGQDIGREKPLFWEFKKGSAIRKGDLKLVRNGSQWELYDMAVDRTETNDLAAVYPEIVRQMANQWDQWYETCTGETYSI